MPLMLLTRNADYGGLVVGGSILDIKRVDCWIIAHGNYADTKVGKSLKRAVKNGAKDGRPLGLGLDLGEALVDEANAKAGAVTITSASILGAAVYLPLSLGDGERHGRATPAFPHVHILPA